VTHKKNLYLAFTPMINRNYIKVDKIVLARWVDKTLNQAFSSKKYHLRVQKYRDLATLDLKAMDERTRPNNLYIIMN